MFILFLDDERFPEKTVKIKEWRDSFLLPILPDAIKNNINERFVVCRNYDQAVQEIIKNGFPDFVFFDHDLGEEKTGMDFMKFLVDYDIDNNKMPNYVWWYVHSANPIGSKNINAYIENYMKFKNKKI